MIGLVAVTAAGRRAADELAAAWPGQTKDYSGAASQALPRAFAECDAVVAFLATGATVRLLAPLLTGKTADPGVVCVDQARRFAVSLLGGHEGGANELAARVAAVLGAEAVITTATDAAGIPGLDQLGWPVEGDVAAVGRAILDGAPVLLHEDAHWPLPALPDNVSATLSPGEAAARLLITDRTVGLEPCQAILRPPSLVVGLGASRGVSAREVLELIEGVLAHAGVSPASVRRAATIDVKADEPGLLEATTRLGWRLVTYPAHVLAGVEVPNPSERVRAEVSTPSVAEAAALVGGGTLLVAKTRSTSRDAAPMATAALTRLAPRGRLAVVGLGPGARDLLTERARRELRAASVVVGLDQYVAQVRDLLRPGTRVLSTPLGSEEERARSAVEQARAGNAVALIGSGDAGVYAMASPAIEAADVSIDVVGVPGVSAAVAASAIVGAPLGHDHAYLSLSDLHTPWEVIQARARAAAHGDFVLCLYNPRSRGRDWQLGAVLDLLAEQRRADTPVALVREASRPGERATLTTLGELRASRDGGGPTSAGLYHDVDMYTVVLVGSSRTRNVAGRMVTPRGYTWQPP